MEFAYKVFGDMCLKEDTPPPGPICNAETVVIPKLSLVFPFMLLRFNLANQCFK